MQMEEGRWEIAPVAPLELDKKPHLVGKPV